MIYFAENNWFWLHSHGDFNTDKVRNLSGVRAYVWALLPSNAWGILRHAPLSLR